MTDVQRLRFWKDTRDRFFLAFGAAFVIDAFDRVPLLFVERPDEGNAWTHLIRLTAFLLMLAAILQKNFGPPGD